MAELYNRTIEVYQYSTGIVCLFVCVCVCVCLCMCVYVYMYVHTYICNAHIYTCQNSGCTIFEATIYTHASVNASSLYCIDAILYCLIM